MDFQKKQILDEQEKSRKLQEFIAEYGKEEGLKKYREWEEEFDEETGYDANTVGRLPDLLPDCSVKRLKEAGADAIKF